MPNSPGLAIGLSINWCSHSKKPVWQEKALSFHKLGFSEISPPQSLLPSNVQILNSMLINLFIIVFILLVIHCVWQNNKINNKKKKTGVTSPEGRAAATSKEWRDSRTASFFPPRSWRRGKGALVAGWRKTFQIPTEKKFKPAIITAKCV